MEKLNQKLFFKRYSISEEDFEKANLIWEDLNNIHNDFLSQNNILEETGTYISNNLMKLRRVHSVRFRVKNPSHLIEKIIRKKIENPDRIISLDNYMENITDLIGVRAIHLFKEEWEIIHKHICKTWDLIEPPTAYYRAGDTNVYTDKFREKGCEIKEHPYGYRSVHYIIPTKPAKQTFYVEIQVRTIFEEGWSEIDHKIRYPYEINNELYNQFLSILNRLAGSADEMGSFIRRLQDFLEEREWGHDEELTEKNKRIKELEDIIQKSNLKPSEKTELKSAIEPPIDWGKIATALSASISKPDK